MIIANNGICLLQNGIVKKYFMYVFYLGYHVHSHNHYVFTIKKQLISVSAVFSL